MSKEWLSGEKPTIGSILCQPTSHHFLGSGTVASGVEYAPNNRIKHDAGSQVITARARRMVVLSAGTFGSPAILERSGIGSPEVLKKISVKEIVDLPGVGENFQGSLSYGKMCTEYATLIHYNMQITCW